MSTIKFTKVDEEVVTTSRGEVVKFRIRAITDEVGFRHAKLLNMKPVKIERQVKGNSYTLVDTCESIYKSGSVIMGYINSLCL